ncbi:MAG: MarR family winged helix-turn-helix transcriptional regulator [Acidimicrobiia bacterium]
MDPPLGRRLYLGHRAVHDTLDERMGAIGASLWHWILLRQAAADEGSSQRELADLMHIEPPTLVRHLDKLAQQGLVERRRDPNDRRIARVYVTDLGRRRLQELHGIAYEADIELRALLTEEQIEVLGDALMVIHEHFTEKKEPSGVNQR